MPYWRGPSLKTKKATLHVAHHVGSAVVHAVMHLSVLIITPWW